MRHAERTGLDDPATVFATVAILQAAGLVTTPRVAGDEPPARLLRLLDLVLSPRLEVTSADGVAGALHRALRPAFSPLGAAAAIAIGALGGIALARTFRLASPEDFGLAGLVVAFVGLAVAGLGHEAAHAIATKAEGRHVGRAGVGLIWFTPIMWVDTSDAWFIGRTRRAIVNAAGPLFNFALAGLFGIVAALSTGRVQDLAVWFAIANLVSVVFNLSPLLEFDGYYVLSDLANVNALRRKSLRFVFAELIRNPRRPRTRLEAGFIAYTVAAGAYVLATSVVLLSGVPGMVTGIVPATVGDDLRLPAGAVIALLMTTLLVGPFISEIAAARKSAEPSGAHAERLEERISKSDLGAAMSARSSAPVLHKPSETRR
jgi:hypothetical protein